MLGGKRVLSVGRLDDLTITVASFLAWVTVRNSAMVTQRIFLKRIQTTVFPNQSLIFPTTLFQIGRNSQNMTKEVLFSSKDFYNLQVV